MCQALNLASPGVFTLADKIYIYKPDGVTDFNANIYAQATQVTSTITVDILGGLGGAVFTNLPVAYAWQTLTPMNIIGLPAAAGFYEVRIIANSVLFLTTFDLRGLEVFPNI